MDGKKSYPELYIYRNGTKEEVTKEAEKFRNKLFFPERRTYQLERIF